MVGMLRATSNNPLPILGLAGAAAIIWPGWCYCCYCVEPALVLGLCGGAVALLSLLMACSPVTASSSLLIIAVHIGVA
eukprot:SAG31_NODE_28925_length_403_cov_1.023026_2_plen_77_part_01